VAQHRDSARESILTAFQELLIETNGAGATLDDVAHRAGVTKGGLLYHFGSRKALELALCDRAQVLGDEDYARMAAAPGGPASYYMALAEYIDSPLDRTARALGFLAKRNPRAQAVLSESRALFFQLLADDLGDPALARATMLLTDGLYYDALVIGVPFEHELDVAAFIGRMRATAP
jgi:AcrR family transcriptional regulator